MKIKTQCATVVAAVLIVTHQAAAQERTTSWYGSGEQESVIDHSDMAMRAPGYGAPYAAPYAHVWQGYRGAAYEHDIHGLRYHSKPRLSDFLVYLFAPPHSTHCGIIGCNCGGSHKYTEESDAHDSDATEDSAATEDRRQWQTRDLDIPRPIQPRPLETRPIESRPIESRPNVAIPDARPLVTPRESEAPGPIPIIVPRNDLPVTPRPTDSQAQRGVIQLAPVPTQPSAEPQPATAPREASPPPKLPRNRLPAEQSSRRKSIHSTVAIPANDDSQQGHVLTAALLKVLGDG